jgi:hypothetical protein
MSPDVDTNKRQSERRNIETEIEFLIEDKGEILSAHSVDLSEKGIRLDTEHPLKVTLRYVVDGKTHIQLARMVWARREEDNTYQYGLEFIE